jgi:tetratricopeptide (TPR) repeat protein
MARTVIALNQLDDADSFYHRAIYGSWSDGAPANQNRVRLELADWLAKRQSKDELLAELMPLQPAARRDPPMSRRLAELFLVAGSPARAAAEYRALIADHPEDAALYKGLGQAELESGNYRAAERAFQEALRKNPDDREIEERMRMIRAVIALDPTPRRATVNGEVPPQHAPRDPLR